MRIFKILSKLTLAFVAFVGVCALAAHFTFKHYASSSFAEAKMQIPFDAIIVPGLPYQDASVNALYKARVLWAKHLFDSGYTKNIIFSGAAVHTPYVESRTMKLCAIALGIPEKNLITEEMAEHSSENIYYGWKLARRLGFKKVALATDPYQSGMLRSLMAEFTPGLQSLPIQFEKINVEAANFPVINLTSARVNPFTPLNRREGFWERFQGTLGKRLKPDATTAQP